MHHCLSQKSCKSKQCCEAATQTVKNQATEPTIELAANPLDAEPNDVIRSEAAERAIASVENSSGMELNDDIQIETAGPIENPNASSENPLAIETNDIQREPSMNIVPKLHCPFCNAPFSKSSALKDHIAEFCTKSNAKAAKDMECKICYKKYTLRGLRVHFNNYTTGKHNARGAHANYTPEEHEIFKAAAMNGFEYP